MSIQIISRVLPFAMAAFACGQAFAADLDTLPPAPASAGGSYGNLHGTLGADVPDQATFRIVPWVNVGGKYAYEGAAGELGFQFDADYWYQDYGFAVPSYAPLNGIGTSFDTALHLTYRLGEDKKLGLFAAYRSDYGYLRDTSGPNLPGGLQATTTTTNIVGLGVEGLWAINPANTVQLRASGITRVFNQAMQDTGTGPVTSGGWQLNPSDRGAVLEASATHAFTPNISMSADIGVADAYWASTNTTWLAYGGTAGVQYTFDDLPVSLGVQGGYAAESTAGVWTGNYTAATKMTYSFGGPSYGAQGKLFRSGLLNFLF